MWYIFNILVHYISHLPRLHKMSSRPGPQIFYSCYSYNCQGPSTSIKFHLQATNFLTPMLKISFLCYSALTLTHVAYMKLFIMCDNQ